MPLSDPFTAAVNFLIDDLEGGGKLVKDSGGWTRWGISEKGNPDIDAKTLTRERAVELYRERYWLKAKCNELPPALALVFFCAFVNLPPLEAVRCLQRAARVKADGIIGPKTLAAARTWHPQSELRARLSRFVTEHYVETAERYPYTRIWRGGWIARAARVGDEAGKWSVRNA